MSRLAWHFLHPGSRLRTGEAAPPDGEWLKHDGPVVLFESGLDAAELALDALDCFAPPLPEVVPCRVEVRGMIEEASGLLVASERRILWRLDGEATDRVLREFARWSALQVLHLWDAPQVVRGYLGTGDEVLREAAREAAGAAADAAWDAAGAAGAAVREAARAAAGAAWDAAGAAGAAADAAAWAVVGAVVGVAAWATAWEAARDEQNTELERLLSEACEARS